MGKSLKGKELGKGISQRKEDGLYVGRFTDRFGKRRIFYSKTLSEIRTKMRDEIYLDNHLQNPIDSSMTLNEWYDVWIATYGKKCRNTTLHEYEKSYNKVRPVLGNLRLSEITPFLIQRMMNDLKSDSMRKNVKIVLCSMLNKAVVAQLIKSNPCSRIDTKLDGCSDAEVRFLSDVEIKVLKEALKKKPLRKRLYDITVIGLDTGMRIGEILGLSFDDLDFERDLIRVRHTLVYVNGSYELHSPKTKAGIRDIPMGKEVREILLAKRSEDGEGLVFKSRLGRPVSHSSIRHGFGIVTEEAGLSGVHFHTLRHTFATKCIRNGMRSKTLQKILGHSTITMTMDLYCHVSEESIAEEMALVVDMG